MKRALIYLVLINISFILNGQNHPDLGLNGVVTWVDSTHIKVEYDWSSDAQLLDWTQLSTGTTLVRGNGVVTVTGGSYSVWTMQWKQRIKCSRILAENVKTGANRHVNIYTNKDGLYDGEWNPPVNIGVVLRGVGSLWLNNTTTTDLTGYWPVANSPETYDLNISEQGMTFKSSVDNVLHTYTGALTPTLDRFIALGAYQDNTEWGKLTIEGEVTLPWQSEPIPSNTINIQSNGAVFAPVIQVVGTPTIEWVFADGTTSVSATPTKNYGSTGSRHNYLKVTPWSAVVGLNLGYDAYDSGYSPDIALHPSQNVLGFQNLEYLKGSLKRLSMLSNPLTELDLRGFTALEFIELYHCMSLTTLNLGTHPNLERLCIENCNLYALDISGCPALKVFDGALNHYPYINWGSTGQAIWHLCIGNNPKFTEQLPVFSTFPNLTQLLISNINQSGALVINNSHLAYIHADYNNYTTADFRGCNSLNEIILPGNMLTSILFDTVNIITLMDLQDNDLSQSQIDYILHTLDGAGQSYGTLYLTGNAAPSAEGLVHRDNLIGRGWTITITKVPVTGLTVSGAGGATNITTDNGTLQLSAAVLPANATDKTVTWSIVNGTGQATINSTGLVTAVNNGTVTARATANDGSGVYDNLIITISPVTGITVTKEKTEPMKIIVTSYEIKILLNDDYISWKAGLYNLLGGLVLSKLVESDISTFDISSLPSGIYIVVLSKGENRRVAKVIKP